MFFHTMNVYLEPVVNALKIIGGKWKIAILNRLNQSPCRFGELKNPIANNGMLTKQLRELEKDGLISRQVFNVIPPKVEYSLTQFGLSLKPVMSSSCKWVSENKKHI